MSEATEAIHRAWTEYGREDHFVFGSELAEEGLSAYVGERRVGAFGCCVEGGRIQRCLHDRRRRNAEQQCRHHAGARKEFPYGGDDGFDLVTMESDFAYAQDPAVVLVQLPEANS